MLSIKLEAEVSTREPDIDVGLISWWTIGVTREDPDAPSRRLDVGRLRIAVIHAGLALNLGEAIDDALDADSAELEGVYETFFEEQWLRDEFQTGHGGDLLYVAEVALPDLWRRRDADLAVLERIADVLGQGCDIVVLNEDEIAALPRWTRIGFAAVEGNGTRFLYRDQSFEHARAAEVGDDRFEVREPPNADVDDDGDDGPPA